MSIKNVKGRKKRRAEKEEQYKRVRESRREGKVREESRLDGREGRRREGRNGGGEGEELLPEPEGLAVSVMEACRGREPLQVELAF